MENKNKKQIIIGIILGIAISFITILLLTTPLPQLKAQQQTKYTVFKTENEGFKFFKLKISHYKLIQDTSSPVLSYSTTVNRLACDKSEFDTDCGATVNQTYVSDTAYDIDGGCNWQGTCWRRYRAYSYVGNNTYQRSENLDFGWDYNWTQNNQKRYFYYPGKTPTPNELPWCDLGISDYECLNKISTYFQKGYDLKETWSGNKVTLSAIPITSQPNYASEFAPIFADLSIYTARLWLRVPEARGDPFNPLNWPGNAEIVLECDNNNKRLSAKVQTENNKDFAIKGGNYANYQDITWPEDYSRSEKDSPTKYVPCFENIFFAYPLVPAQIESGFENERRYIGVYPETRLVTYYPSSNIKISNQIYLKIKWIARGGTYEVPLDIIIIGVPK